MWCFLLCFGLVATRRPQYEYADGDIIIGGLFPIHSYPNHTFPSSEDVLCKNYDVRTFLRSQMMIFAINEKNQRKLLPNVTLGYDIYDTCSDVSLAMRIALDMSKDQSDYQGCSSPTIPRVKAVIGEITSEVTIAVARILTLSSIPQVTYASSEKLSSKTKFPTFLRSGPSDAHQTKAIADLVKRFNWETVGLVGSDDEYGKYGSERLADHFSAMDNICLDFKVTLPGDLNLNMSKHRRQFNSLMDTIENSTAEAIILFTKGSNVKLVMESVIRKNLSRTWVASDAWSDSFQIRELQGIEAIGSVFGINYKAQIEPRFVEYISASVEGNSSKRSWQDYLLKNPPCCNASQEAMHCSLTGDKCMDKRCLVHYIPWAGALNTYMAVEVVAQGLRSLMECDSKQCKRNNSFTAYELFNEIKKVNFTMNKKQIAFDGNGELGLGYDIFVWNRSRIEIIGEYFPRGNITLLDDLVAKMRNVTVTAFNCDKSCSAGYELIHNGKRCCKQCSPCRDGHVSPGGGEPCAKCEDSQYSSDQQDRCQEKNTQFLKLSNPLIISLLVFIVLGFLATVTVGIIFVVNKNTPIVKAVGGYLCFLELFSLLACYGLSVAFVVRPTTSSCIAGMPFFGMAFTLCVSCILANLLQILVGFNFALTNRDWLKKLNLPLAVVAIVFGVQLVLCSVWLVGYPPFVLKDPDDKAIDLECDTGSNALFCAMVVYVALLATVCFVFAFKGKKLPDLYKNASFVSIGMLLVLVVWIVFVPVYIYRAGRYTHAIEGAAVLVSSYSMLCCHLVPKCFIMLCKKELNDEKAITDYIKNHYDQKGINVLQS